MRNPAVNIDSRRVMLDNVQKHFENAARALISNKRQQFLVATSKLESLSPLGIMNRGFAAVKSEKGEVVKLAKQLKRRDILNVMFADGTAECEVLGVVADE